MTKMCQNVTVCNVEPLQFVAYTPLFILGLVLNTMALWAFVTIRRPWTDTRIYMLNLTAADLALIVFLPFRMVDAFHCLSKTYLCTFLIFTHYINMYASIMTSAAISVHRFLTVKFPLRAKGWRWKKLTAFVVCLMIWVLVITLCVVYRDANYPENLQTCYERCEGKKFPKVFLALIVAVGFLIPLLIVVCCSRQTILILWREKDTSVEKNNIVGIVTANMIVFIFCYTPIHVSFLLKYTDYIDWTTAHHILLVSEWIATTNCCLDSISYYFLFKYLQQK